MSDQKKGVLLTLTGVICLAPDALLFRLLNKNPWDLLFWKGLLVGVGIFLFSRMSQYPIRAAILTGGLNSLMIITCESLNNIFFYLALNLTSAFNVLIIMSSIPVCAAALGWLLLGEATKRRTWIAIGVISAAVVLLSFGGNQDGSSLDRGNFIGIVFAIAAALFTAGGFVFIRRAPRMVNMTPAIGFGNLVMSTLIMLWVHPIAVLDSQHSIILILLMGMFSTAAFTALALAPRYINAAEISLFLPLETILGTFLVWAVLGEPMNTMTIIAGILIIGTAIIYVWDDFSVV